MAQSTPLRSSCVLVVEDDPLLMLLLVSFVEEAGFEAVEATTIDEAIDILETRTDIRTVFADLDMRGSTAGMNFALSIRDRWPPIELLMVSAQPWTRARMPARGILIGKPFDRRKVIAALQNFGA